MPLKVPPDEGRTLAEMLADNKQKREEAFREQWRTIKQGKNRPLDAEDFAFVDAVYKQETQKTKEQFDHAQRDLEDFKKARNALEKKEEVKTKPSVRLTTKKRPSWKPVVKVVPKKRISTVSDVDDVSKTCKRKATHS